MRPGPRSGRIRVCMDLKPTRERWQGAHLPINRTHQTQTHCHAERSEASALKIRPSPLPACGRTGAPGLAFETWETTKLEGQDFHGLGVAQSAMYDCGSISQTSAWAVIRSHQTQTHCHAERSEASAVAFSQTSELAVIHQQAADSTSFSFGRIQIERSQVGFECSGRWQFASIWEAAINGFDDLFCLRLVEMRQNAVTFVPQPKSGAEMLDVKPFRKLGEIAAAGGIAILKLVDVCPCDCGGVIVFRRVARADEIEVGDV